LERICFESDAPPMGGVGSAVDFAIEWSDAPPIAPVGSGDESEGDGPDRGGRTAGVFEVPPIPLE
jgi:hypothetical protein